MGWLTNILRASSGSRTPAPPTDTPVDARPKIGDVNVLEASVGQRGAGKSTWQCIRADELASSFGGAYVIGHSLGARLPDRFPDGREIPITYHESLKKLEQGMRRSPDRWHVLAPPLNAAHRETADDLLQFSVRMSDAIKKEAWTRAHPFSLYKPHKAKFHDVHATPIIVIIDEGIAIEAASKSKSEANRWFYEYLYSLRHMHIALLYAIQDPSARSWRILEQATEIHVFNLRHQWALDAIRAAGATDDELERISQLPTPKQLKAGTRKHEHVSLALEGVTRGDAPVWAQESGG